ncbi:MAG TPA: hypothetical protein VF691_06645 [Cytophagaceae bacterium]
MNKTNTNAKEITLPTDMQTWMFWRFLRQDDHPVECSTKVILESKLRYLHEILSERISFEMNGICFSLGIDDYTGEKGLLTIIFFNLQYRRHYNHS